MSNLKIDTSKCGLNHFPSKKRLGGVISDISDIDIILIGNQNILPYQEAKNYIFQISKGLINLNYHFTIIPEQKFKIKHHSTFYTIEIFEEENLFSKSNFIMRQIIYSPSIYQGFSPFYSCAYLGGRENIQFSQIVAPTIWTEPLHEFFHSWYSYFGLPDRTHEIINKHGGWVEKAFPEIIEEFLTVWPRKKLPLLFHYPAPKR